LVATRATRVWSRFLRVGADERVLERDHVQIRWQGEEQGSYARDERRRKRCAGAEAVRADLVGGVDVRARSGKLDRVRPPVPRMSRRCLHCRNCRGSARANNSADRCRTSCFRRRRRRGRVTCLPHLVEQGRS
jgi:hypothetical protein